MTETMPEFDPVALIESLDQTVLEARLARVEREASCLRAILRFVKESPTPSSVPRKRQSAELHRETVAKYLIEHGPTHRSDLATATGVPSSSLGRLLRQGDDFKQLDDGRWGPAVELIRGDETNGAAHE